MKKIMFKGIMPALITPFDENGKLIRASVKQLVDLHLSQGVDGFYICGSTGEGPALRKELRMEMAEATMEAVAGRGVVIAHTGAPNIFDAIDLTRHATDIGVDAISSLPPMYTFKYTEDELFNYYKTLVDNTDKPIIVYATNMMANMNVNNLLNRLIKIDSIIGVKFTIRDYFRMRKVKEINGGNINLINGPDETLLCGLTMGADGGIGTTYNVLAPWFVELYSAYKKGDIKKAEEMQHKIDLCVDILIKYSRNGAIKATKEVLNMMGINVGTAIYPSSPLPKHEALALKKELQTLGVEF